METMNQPLHKMVVDLSAQIPNNKPQINLVCSGNMIINADHVVWANLGANVGTDEDPVDGVVVQFKSTTDAFRGNDATDIANALLSAALNVTPVETKTA